MFITGMPLLNNDWDLPAQLSLKSSTYHLST
ncbi:hypothetical protein PAE0469 [Pyrobaculum aerophilum str. IM2]|uniref:Uncharacterized protein n=1 Tax=Pyrobaculum aerophilum (strain ATCC 51768 / DSM 7523 / JCM 9630 / CIP 104966 / NBRC 100827 / IM2) TaxID=178306 RepID=Q8ZZ30_PYRAE|nr:hypothetical protein PAE0469 [Pyrobaculum aerophilum str. IM2]